MNRVEIKTELLRWARERAGVSVDALAQRFPKLEAWERGEAHPTLKQLEIYAKATHTPIGFLFLSAPPVEEVPIPDFRTVGNAHIGHPSPDLLETIYLCQQRQEWYRDFVRAAGEERLKLVGSAQTRDDVVNTAARIRHVLGFDLDERRRILTWTDALRRFIEQADTLGVLVMVSGVVGSNNRRKLDPQEFRGFALVDDDAPLVFINGADTKAAQMFTLAHELAHIFLGQSAVSDAQALAVPDHAVERWCNRVAAELLVPLAALREEHNRRVALRDETDRLARCFKVSTLVILRRIYDAGGLSREAFWQAYEEELARLRALPKGGGGDFYLTLGARASKTFARAGDQYFGRPHTLHGGIPPARLQEDGHFPRGRTQPGGRFLMAYLLDSNVFIAAKNLHYGLDFCPAFWDWLVAQNGTGRVFSIEKVGDEVQAVADELSAWAAARGEGFFLKPDAKVVPSLAAVSSWATSQRYGMAAISTFLQVADYYLVAHAHGGSHTVVTHEVPAASPRKIKIPDACIGLGIKCMTPFEMLRRERARFVLGAHP